MPESKRKYNTFYSLKFKLAFTLLFSLISLAGFSQANIYVLKAVYLEKFSRFVTWPEECEMKNINKPFVIGVIGKTPLYKNLEQIYSIQKINQKKVIVKEIKEYQEIEDCHILFIAESERKNLNNLISFTKKLNVVTVGDSPKFAEKGVLINFIEEKNKLKFEINESAVLESPIQMSFYLMNSAKIVNPVKEN